MKVLQVNCVYNKGSTGKIVADIHNGLIERGIESVVCYGRGEQTTLPNVYKVCGEFYSKLQNLRSRITGLMYGGCTLSTRRLIKVIEKERPDIVHLHCINGYFVNIYKIVQWLKNNNIRTVLTLHAEFIHTANCGHAFDCEEWKTGCRNCTQFKSQTKSIFFNRTHTSWQKMKKAFDGFDNLIVASVSPWLMERAKQSPILADKEHCVVLNGLDTEIFKFYQTENLRKAMGIEGKKVIFHATPFFHSNQQDIKGGYYIIELAKRLLEKQEYQIVIAGNYDKNISVPSNVTFLGRVSDQEQLAKLYSMADLTVLTSKRETFSMVVSESLTCGTPVVGFNAGAPEQIAINEFSSFIEYGDIDTLEEKVIKFTNTDFDKKVIAEKAKQKYNRDKFVEENIKLYKKT
ncbi:MAG: glycosyltransferase [Clostridiales bacterium]|nr:glycosyltransferase [Clostridiales bacterium]